MNLFTIFAPEGDNYAQFAPSASICVVVFGLIASSLCQRPTFDRGAEVELAVFANFDPEKMVFLKNQATWFEVQTSD
ncbi:hypothetical protein AKJ16_DCAP00867 [Drosera capensis]